MLCFAKQEGFTLMKEQAQSDIYITIWIDYKVDR